MYAIVMNGTRLGLTWTYVYKWAPAVLMRHCHSHAKSQGRTRSCLFVSDSLGQHTSLVSVDLDLERRLVAEGHLLKDNLRARRIVDIDVDKLVEDYKKMAALRAAKDELLVKKKNNAKNMKALLASKKEVSDSLDLQKQAFVEKGASIKQEIKNTTRHLWAVEDTVMSTCIRLPAELHPSTPEVEVVIKESGVDPVLLERAACASHVETLTNSGLLQLSPASPSGYFLLGPLAEKELSLVHTCTQMLLEQNFTPFTCSDIFKTLVVEGCGVDFQDKDKILTLQEKEDLRTRDSQYTWDTTYHLAGATPMSFAAYFTRMNLNQQALPLRCYCVGRRYTPPPTDGAGYRDLVTAIQGTSVQLFGATLTSGDSLSMLEEFASLLWQVHVDLLGAGVHLRLINEPIHHLAIGEMVRWSLQAWLPSIGEYCQLASVSACGDYISRRLMMKCSSDEKTTAGATYLNTVHARMLDVPKLLAVMEEHGPRDWLPEKCVTSELG